MENTNINYRFLDDKHVHQILIDGTWKNLIGTSSIPGVLAKPLTWWAAGLAVGVLGWTAKKDKDKWVSTDKRVAKAQEKLDEIKTMDGKQYLALLDEGYVAHSKKLDSTAQAGTDLHALAEQWIKGQINGKPIAPHQQIMPLVNWAKENVDKWLWSEMNCYSQEEWLGGITDAGFLDKQGRVAILDIKSSKEAYISQFIQCAGYDIQISEQGGYTKDGVKVFDLGDNKISYYAILPFGMENPTVQTRHNVDDLKGAFKACLQLYKLLN